MANMGRLTVGGFDGAALSELRRRYDLTQEDLAVMIGLQSSSSISAWEKGVSIPGPANFSRLVEVLGVTPDALLKPPDELGGIGQYRTRAAMSQPQAAKETGIGLTALRLIERGVRPPDDDEVAALARAYGVPETEVRRLAVNLYEHRRGRRP